MPDHATLGGYPVVAVVASADHGLLGQCAPGTRVRLVPWSSTRRRAGAWRARRRRARRRGLGHYPRGGGLTAVQTSSLIAVPTPITTTTARSAGAGSASASRAPT